MDLKIIDGRRDIGLAMTIASAVAMGLVVCIHLPTLPKGGVLEWGVPWFFFASGFWFARSRRTVLENIKIRVKSLLLPYYLWNVIWFPILFIFNWVGWRYFGAKRVVDGSVECIVRCMGLSPFAWPALVPTWFLRALFATVVVVGLLDWTFRQIVPMGKMFLKASVSRWLVCLLCLVMYWMWCLLGSKETLLHSFFVFGLPLGGCAWFSMGMVIREVMCAVNEKEESVALSDERSRKWREGIHRQIMPVYLIHVPVILLVGWLCKAFHCYGMLETIGGDVVMWFVSVGGAIVIGEFMRRRCPQCARLLLGGR